MLARSTSFTRPASLALAALAAATAASATVAATDAAARYDAARDQYEIGHFEEAFDEFAALADRGHCEAARIARQMVRYGRALYVIPFAVAPERLERWGRLPGCSAVGPTPR